MRRRGAARGEAVTPTVCTLHGSDFDGPLAVVVLDEPEAVSPSDSQPVLRIEYAHMRSYVIQCGGGRGSPCRPGAKHLRPACCWPLGLGR